MGLPMPVGRFRTDPRELDEVEREVSAQQLPEAALTVGTGAGLALGMLSVLPAPLATLLPTPALTIIGGIVGYLLGFRLKRHRIEKRRDRA